LDYIAPEILQEAATATKSSDMFSSGVIFLLLHSPELERVTRIPQEGEIAVEIPNYKNESLKDLLQGLLKRNPDARLSANESLSHPFFTTANPEEKEKLKRAQNIDFIKRPVYWETNERLGMKTVQLKNIETFQKLLDETATKKIGRVVRVERIENGILFEDYSICQNHLKIKHSLDNIKVQKVKTTRDWMILEKSVNEVYLFHGTKKNVLNIIFSHGFDERVSNNGRYGHGFRFSSLERIFFNYS